MEQKNSNKTGIIFIPDISGFTKFVSTTEIEHSRKIIGELLEVLLDSNILEFVPSEIEGDAILFYKMRDIPSLKEILTQIEEMFLNFHNYLVDITATNICTCGACKSAHNLSLKFIIHLGEVHELKIKQFNNIMGADVILAHRLLKNSVGLNEYVLFTEMYLSTQNEKDINEYCENLEHYDNFGEVKTYYLSLDYLREKINKIPFQNFVPETFNPDIEMKIFADPFSVYSVLIDNSKKMDWVPGIKRIIEDNKLNRINHTHICEFDMMDIEFTTSSAGTSGTKRFYSENIKVGKYINFTDEYLLVEDNGNTNLYYRIVKRMDNEAGILSGFLTNIFILMFIGKQKRALKKFKSLCEIK